MHPQFGASSARQHCELPQLQDNLTGFEWLPGFAFQEIKGGLAAISLAKMPSAVLRCAVLRCAALCCAVLRCAALCCAVLCCAVLCCAVSCHAMRCLAMSLAKALLSCIMLMQVLSQLPLPAHNWAYVKYGGVWCRQCLECPD